MKAVKLAYFLMLLAVTGLRDQTNQNSIVGTWESDEKDVRMEYFQEGDHYNARLLWGNQNRPSGWHNVEARFKEPR